VRIRILGTHNIETRDTRHTCFLIDGTVAVDAGSLASALTSREIDGVRHVLLTHEHFDHVRDLPTIALATMDRTEPLALSGLRATLDSVHHHLMDGTIYPDLSKPLNENPPACAFHPVEIGRPIEAHGLSIKPVMAYHPVPAASYLLRSAGRCVAFTGDTGGNLVALFQDQWAPSIAFIDMTFPNRLAWRAAVSGHLTPVLLRQEIEKALQRGIRVPRLIAVHRNFGDDDEIARELDNVRQVTGVAVEMAAENQVVS
jgi:phosphoribosyl 1,2-cyclic phosphodiesterase